MAGAAQNAINEATAVSRLRYETAARMTLGQALLRLQHHERAEAELRAALAGAEALTHPPTLWLAWWHLGRALTATGDDAGAADAFAKAAEIIRGFAAGLGPTWSERILAAEPVREILASA